MEQRLLDASFLAPENLANSIILSRNLATVDASGMLYTPPAGMRASASLSGCDGYRCIGVGFCVARFYRIGQCESL